MYYPDEVIEEVRSRNDIVDVIGSYVKLQKKGSSYFGLCPFHNEKSPSFSVSRDKQMYYCFGCGAGGNVFTFLMEYENFSFVEALKFLADRAGVQLPQEEYSAEAKRRADLRTSILEVNKLAAKYFYAQLRSPQGKTAWDYLRGRQLGEDTILAFGLGYANKYSDDLYRYIVELVQATRTHSSIASGASPRAGIALAAAARARAWTKGRDYAIPEDILYLFHEIMGHRIRLKGENGHDMERTNAVLDDILRKVAQPLL